MKFQKILLAIQLILRATSLIAQNPKSQETQGENHVAARAPRHGEAQSLSSIPYRDWETDRKSTRLNSSHRL